MPRSPRFELFCTALPVSRNRWLQLKSVGCASMITQGQPLPSPLPPPPNFQTHCCNFTLQLLHCPLPYLGSTPGPPRRSLAHPIPRTTQCSFLNPAGCLACHPSRALLVAWTLTCSKCSSGGQLRPLPQRLCRSWGCGWPVGMLKSIVDSSSGGKIARAIR